MSVADEFSIVAPGLFYWEAYDPTVKTHLCCVATQTAAGLVFIDPIPLTSDAWEELLSHGEPAAVVATSNNHLRACVETARRAHVPFYAHAGASGDWPDAPDRTLGGGDTLAGELQVVEIPGAALGEIALWSPTLRRLHFGDAVVNTPPYGLAPLPEKYCEDPRAFRATFPRLAALQPKIVTFAHGTPLVSEAASRLTAALR